MVHAFTWGQKLPRGEVLVTRSDKALRAGRFITQRRKVGKDAKIILKMLATVLLESVKHGSLYILFYFASLPPLRLCVKWCHSCSESCLSQCCS